MTPFDETILSGKIKPSSVAMYGTSFRAYIEYCGDFEKCLDPHRFQEWVSYMISDTIYSYQTISRNVGAIKSIMTEAYRQGLISAEKSYAFSLVTVGSKKELRHRDRPHNRVRITPEQMRAICESPDTRTLVGLRNRALLFTMASSGARVSEVVSITLGDIGQDEKGNHYAEIIGKRNDEPRKVPISQEAMEHIEKWLYTRPVFSDFIFTAFDGSGVRLTNRPMSSVAAWNIVSAAASNVGIEHVKPHDFRRFVATQVGKDNLFQAQKILGHSNMDTTYTYYVMADMELGLTDDLF